LESLVAFDNQLQQIPDGLEESVNLRVINFQNNKITKFPFLEGISLYSMRELN
jgi:Leucine-rich repeat (LRR) protein